MSRPHSSRQRYNEFVRSFRARELDAEGQTDSKKPSTDPHGADAPPGDKKPTSVKRRALFRRFLPLPLPRL